MDIEDNVGDNNSPSSSLPISCMELRVCAARVNLVLDEGLRDLETVALRCTHTPFLSTRIYPSLLFICDAVVHKPPSEMTESVEKKNYTTDIRVRNACQKMNYLRNTPKKRSCGLLINYATTEFKDKKKSGSK